MLSKYFLILNLPPNASQQEAKKAYKFLARKWHPDRFDNESETIKQQAKNKFLKIKQAYQKIESTYSVRSNPRYSGSSPIEPFQHATTCPGQDETEDSRNRNDYVQTEEVVGFFVRVWPNGDRYEGQISQNLFQGMGFLKTAAGTKYTGQFLFGKTHGQGKMDFANGDSYRGEFKDDYIDGKGTYTYSNGNKFIGFFKEGLPHGEGIYVGKGGVQAGNWESGMLLD